MDEKPTVQMDAHSEEEPSRGKAESPPTIPIDDMFQEPEWPPPVRESAPPRFGAPPPPPDYESTPAGRTVIMGPETSAPLFAWLAIAEGPGAPRGQVFTLERETVIGRKGGQIVLAGDACVSGQHAKVRLESSEADEETQTFVLYDLASANGTFAGERGEYRDNRVYRHELKDGDFMLLGETTLVFKQVEFGDKS